ncbi:porin [Undibacterium fentianense]|uniref:Porin n=1 Tax=Undibacterium fentianense TaxID=2828728 RepID=A0A941E1E5_9BURK|nr:porin [Undibacterium fentianense]MBR7801459.1 porin [Undibacterium fentianense]
MGRVKTVSIRSALAFLCFSGVSGVSQAIDFTYSGFGNITAGRVFSAAGLETGFPDNTKWQCPCYIADYSHGSVYEKRWNFAPESRFGFQGTASFTDNFSFTGQLMARHAAGDADLAVEQAFFSYNISPKFTLQVGRKRLPLFFYSDFQDVAFAYNWARVPPDVYGWPVVNYNGANLTFRDDIGGWAVKSTVYVGKEHSKEVPIAKLGDPSRVDVEWDNMYGIDLELNRDWFTARAAINKSKQRRLRLGPNGLEQFSPDPVEFGKSSPQTYSSLSLNVDRDNLVVRSEFSRVNAAPARGSYKGYLIGAGYRMGDFLPMLTVSRLNAYGSTGAPEEVDRNIGVSMRYQLSDGSALKLQLDRSRWDFLNGTDNTRKLITVSYDFTF